jgi:hypothetical protein
MSTLIDRAGHFRGRIISHTLKDFDSGAVALQIDCALDEYWNEDRAGWDDWAEYDVTAPGLVFLVKKDGTINDKQAKALMDFAGWDGSLDTLASGAWEPARCGFAIGEDTYKGVTRYRVDWINVFDGTPGAGTMSPEKVQELQSRYGSQFRAIAGNSARNSAKPEGAPAKAPPAPKPNVGDGPGGKDDIPF